MHNILHYALCILHCALTMWYWTKIVFLIFAGAVGVWLLYELITFPGISRLRDENPTTSSMIEYRISEAKAEGPSRENS